MDIQPWYTNLHRKIPFPNFHITPSLKQIPLNLRRIVQSVLFRIKSIFPNFSSLIASDSDDEDDDETNAALWVPATRYHSQRKSNTDRPTAAPVRRSFQSSEAAVGVSSSPIRNKSYEKWTRFDGGEAFSLHLSFSGPRRFRSTETCDANFSIARARIGSGC